MTVNKLDSLMHKNYQRSHIIKYMTYTLLIRLVKSCKVYHEQLLKNTIQK